MIDIVIPTFNQEKFTVNCLKSIKNHTKDYRVVWVDNGSTNESRLAVLEEIKQHENYLTIWLDKNYGFVQAVNAGLDAGNSEFVVVQNNDTAVTPFWLDRLKKPMNDCKVMITGPMTDTNGSWQGWRNVKNKMLFDMKNLDGLKGEEIAIQLFNEYGEKNIPVKMVAFFSTLFRRKAFHQLGGLDEAMNLGFGDDDDFCFRVLKNGGKILFIPSAFVFHFHRTTFKSLYSDDEIKAMQEKNMKIYKTKHKLI